MGKDTSPEVDAALAVLNRRAHDEELYPDDLSRLTITELEYLVGQAMEHRHGSATIDRLNRNARRARVQLDHRRAVDLQRRQIRSARVTALLVAAVGLAGVWLGATVFADDPATPAPVVVVTTTTAP